MKQVDGQLNMFNDTVYKEPVKQTFIIKGILKRGKYKRDVVDYEEAYSEKQARLLFYKEWEGHKVYIVSCRPL